MRARVIVVDDEPLARDRILSFLEDEKDVEVVASCETGREAVDRIKEKKPDLVFLDVQMPELDGFGVLRELSRDELPAVIFVTAHDRFALRAFEVHALDYLLKPFDRERFRKALRRALDHLAGAQTRQLTDRLASLLSEVTPDSKPLERLSVKTSGRVLLVKIKDIDWIEAADNYASLHIGNETHLHR